MLVDLIIAYIADGLMVRGLGVEQLVRAWLGLDLGQLRTVDRGSGSRPCIYVERPDVHVCMHGREQLALIMSARRSWPAGRSEATPGRAGQNDRARKRAGQRQGRGRTRQAAQGEAGRPSRGAPGLERSGSEPEAGAGWGGAGSRPTWGKLEQARKAAAGRAAGSRKPAQRPILLLLSSFLHIFYIVAPFLDPRSATRS